MLVASSVRFTLTQPTWEAWSVANLASNKHGNTAKRDTKDDKSKHQLGTVGKLRMALFSWPLSHVNASTTCQCPCLERFSDEKKEVGAFMSYRPLWALTSCPTYMGFCRLGLWSFVAWRRRSTTIWPQRYKFLQLLLATFVGNWVVGFLVLGAVEGAEGVAVSFSVGAAMLARLKFIASGGGRLHQMLASGSQ